MQAALYVRVSTREQAQKKTSMEAQERALREYAKEHDIGVMGVYVDDGYSGTTTDRPEFQRMLTEAQDGKFGAILTWKYEQVRKKSDRPRDYHP